VTSKLSKWKNFATLGTTYNCFRIWALFAISNTNNYCNLPNPRNPFHNLVFIYGHWTKNKWMQVIG